MRLYFQVPNRSTEKHKLKQIFNHYLKSKQIATLNGQIEARIEARVRGKTGVWKNRTNRSLPVPFRANPVGGRKLKSKRKTRGEDERRLVRKMREDEKLLRGLCCCSLEYVNEEDGNEEDANERDRKSTRLNSSHRSLSRMPSSA